MTRRLTMLAAALLITVPLSLEAKPKNKKQATTEPTVEAKIEAALARPIELFFDQASLDDVASHLRESLGVPVQIDHAALRDATILMTPPITYIGKGPTLEMALQLILPPVNLSWTVYQGTFLITTPKAAEKFYFTRAYDISDLVARDGDESLDIDQFLETICSLVEPTSWTDVGGQGTLRYIHSTRLHVIVVRQGWRTHRGIAEFLTSIRSVARSKPSVSKSGEPTRAATSVAPQGRMISTLEPNEEVRIRFTSGGCFHFVAFNFLIHGKSPRKMLVTEVDRLSKPTSEQPKGTVTLLEGDLSRIDKQLAFYRKKQPGGRCTTVETIEVSWFRDGTLSKKETFTDATCQKRHDAINWVSLATRANGRPQAVTAAPTE
jgi:hypothetical protein